MLGCFDIIHSLSRLLPRESQVSWLFLIQSLEDLEIRIRYFQLQLTKMVIITGFKRFLSTKTFVCLFVCSFSGRLPVLSLPFLCFPSFKEQFEEHPRFIRRNECKSSINF